MASFLRSGFGGDCKFRVKKVSIFFGEIALLVNTVLFSAGGGYLIGLAEVRYLDSGDFKMVLEPRESLPPKEDKQNAFSWLLVCCGTVVLRAALDCSLSIR